VARENFGPRVVQVAAVALLIDYVVTVAVQTAAGSAAIVSAFPALSRIPVIGSRILLVISVVAILAMCLGNLRGIREAGRIFALPTYLFAGSLVVMIVTGVVRELTGQLPHVVPGTGTVGTGSHSGLITFGALYIMAQAFANGGSSLTGIEAVSNAVSALRPPEGRNARQILATQGTIVAFLIAGISWLAHLTHAMPYTAGFPTILAQEAAAVFGPTPAGHVMFLVHAAEVPPGRHDSNVLACEVADSTGALTAVFYGRTQIAGLEPGCRVRLRGMVGIGADGRPAMINPAYDLLA
jgi:amino acid transporter